MGTLLKKCGIREAYDGLEGNYIKIANGQNILPDLLIIPGLNNPIGTLSSQSFQTETKAFLDTLLNGQDLTLYCDKKAENRRSKLKGPKNTHIFLSEKDLPDRYLQSILIKAGYAILYPAPSSAFTASPHYQTLMKAEYIARRQKRGLWALEAYQTYDAKNVKALAQQTGQFVLVQGTVLNAEHIGKTIYLNFGENWRQDFTVEIDEKAQKRFSTLDITPLNLKGQTINIRGWVDYKAGPRLELLSPYHLKIVEDAENLH